MHSVQVQGTALQTGLVSVTFRHLSPQQIVELAVQAGLCSIEWAADVHAVDVAAARDIGQICQDYGVQTVSLGSYYRAGDGEDFEPVLATALALGAQNIRIWAGSRDANQASESYRQRVVGDIRSICDRAQRHGVAISCEYHRGTLTGTQQGTVELLQQVDCSGFYSYWQPLDNTTHPQNLHNLRQLCAMGKLKHLHVYHWVAGQRLPLQEGAQQWREYFEIAAGCAQAALLEFVRGDDPRQFLVDAQALIHQVGNGV